MATGIFAIQSDSQLIEMTEAPYASEDIFQTLLERYPNLLAGDQIDSNSPRRWLLVQREMAVPDMKNGYGRWSIDHLFLDQDAVPTLVEVKRSTDTRIRREVVGQMLDYAANAVTYWPAEHIRDCYQTTCQSRGVDSAQELMAFLETEPETLETYWQQLQTNLKAGKVRMIFVADKIPTELRRIVEFLNEQMSPAEVIAVEIRQYEGQGLKTLVPKVIGQTAEAQLVKEAAIYRETRQWDENTFIEALAAKNGASAVETVQQILDWAKQRQLEVVWGKGVKSGTFMPFVVHGGIRYRLFRAWSTDSLEIYFKFFRQQSPFENSAHLGTLLDKFYSIPGIEPHNEELRESYSRVQYASLNKGSLGAFLQFFDWVIAELTKA
jgi:hypothetical protein